SIDALFAGITDGVVGILSDPGAPVTPVSNWWYNIVSALFLAAVAGFLIDKVLEPRLVRQGVSVDRLDDGADEGGDELTADSTPRERRALVVALIALAVRSEERRVGKEWRCGW